MTLKNEKQKENPVSDRRGGKSMECIYCGEESNYVPLVTKPSYFIWEENKVSTIDVGKPICLECLHDEMNNTTRIE